MVTHLAPSHRAPYNFRQLKRSYGRKNCQIEDTEGAVEAFLCKPPLPRETNLLAHGPSTSQ